MGNRPLVDLLRLEGLNPATHGAGGFERPLAQRHTTLAETLQKDAKAGADAAKLLAERDRDEFFKKAVADRRIKPAQVEGLKKLYLSDAEGTKAYVLSISPDTVSAVEIGTGSGDVGDDNNPVHKVRTLTAALMEKNPKLSEGAAQEQIFNADRGLYDEYRTAISVREGGK